MTDPISQSVVRAADYLMTPDPRPARESPIVWEETFDVRGAAGPIACWASGAGPVVLLVHGWESTHFDFDGFVAPLLALGRRVVTLDLPAHGASAGKMASIPSIADAIVAVASVVGPVDAVIGHSMGCAASVVAAERGFRVRRLALIAPPERYGYAVEWVASSQQIDLHDLEAELLSRGVDVPTLNVPKSGASRTEPVLIVHSVDDKVCDIDGARRLHAAWRGSEYVEVDGLGHNRILRDPAVIAAVTQFAVRD